MDVRQIRIGAEVLFRVKYGSDPEKVLRGEIVGVPDAKGQMHVIVKALGSLHTFTVGAACRLLSLLTPAEEIVELAD